MEMMRERRGGDMQFLLHVADRQPFITARMSTLYTEGALGCEALRAV